jgi:hypothetical protein
VAKPKPTPRPKKRARRAAFWLGALALATGGLWIGIHEIPWLGPALADGGRALLGPEAIAWSEDVAYGLADTANLWLHGDDAPTTFWEPPPELPVAAAPAPEASGGDAAPAPPGHFPPAVFAPPHAKVAATGDGMWAPMVDPRHPDAPPLLYRTSVHPDPRRPFAAIAVVAIDLAGLDLRFLPGTHEPESNKVPRASRSGQVPRSDYANVLAAWNGGFKAVHGHYGMRIEEQLYLAPRDIACTVGLFRDGRVELGTWSTLKAQDSALWAYRQTPPCLVEEGKTHTGLDVEYNRNWGAAVDGETIIRRSAIGIDRERKILFYGPRRGGDRAVHGARNARRRRGDRRPARHQLLVPALPRVRRDLRRAAYQRGVDQGPQVEGRGLHNRTFHARLLLRRAQEARAARIGEFGGEEVIRAR